MQPLGELLTTGEVAELADVHPSTVRQWVDRGQLAAITLPSGILRFRREDVEKILTPTVRNATGDDNSAVAS